MLIVLTGKTGSGKTTTAKLLGAYGYEKLITDTSRPKRKGEVERVDYNFRTEDEFLKLEKEGKYAETISFNTIYGKWYYGSLKEHYLNSEDNKVIVLNPHGLKQVLDKVDRKNFKSFYLDINEDILLKRLSKRGDDPREVNRRLKIDRIDFKDIYELTDYQIKIKEDDDVQYIVNKILECL